MICSRCQKEVPDESTFCLSCGARLVRAPQLAPVNGGGRPAGAERPPVAADGAPALREAKIGRQAYALSFRPIADDRLRYRIARWVCEHAPAHGLAEVQEGLQRGNFFTFLALTPEEADATRQGIQGLGVAPTLLTLAPATSADMLLPERRTVSSDTGSRPIKRKDLVTIVVVVIVLFIFGLVVVKLFGGRGF